MKDTRKRIVCNVYPTLYFKFKEICENKYSISVNEKISLLIQDYVDKKINIAEMQEGFLLEKQKINEKKNTQITLRINEELYTKLANVLKDDGSNTRPSTVISVLMGYVISKNPLTRADFVHKAELLLEYADESINHVVYGVRHYAYQNDGSWKYVHENYFLHPCTELEFNEIYKKSTPLYDVLAVHR